MTARELILKYWRSWQEPADFDEMQGCLADDVQMDMGMFQAASAAAFRTMVEANPAPWKDIELVDSSFTEDSGSIVYEGTNTDSGRRTRVAEVMHVQDGRIRRITGVLVELPSP